MRNYRWVCHVCEAVNSPDSRVCSNCNFPAEASGAEIDAAMNQNPKAKSQPLSQSNLTPTQKTMGFLAIVMIIISGFVVRFSHSEPYSVVGLILAGLGLLIVKRLGAISDKSKS